MKMKTETDITYSNSNNSSKKFTIASSTKAFKILSNNLYKNKVLAIVRELSCNALDAHKLNGNPEPFEISVPDNLDNTFTLRDFGPGLSHEDMENLYTTYFASTKSDSNEFTGALGLGSKSPFSYTNAFSVISYFDGSASLYSVFLESGEPTIKLIHKEATTEKTGIEITIPVKDSDLLLWRTNITRALVPMDKNCFKFKEGSQKLDIEHIYVDDFSFIKTTASTNFVSDINAIYGNIIYPISLSDIGLTNNDIPWISSNQNNLFIKFELGQLDIAPSREELSYDADTVKSIKDKLLQIESSIRSKYNTFVEENYKENPRAVIRFYLNLRYGEQEAFKKSFTFDGKDYESYFSEYKNPTKLIRLLENDYVKLYHLNGYKRRMSYSGDTKTKVTIQTLLSPKLHNKFTILIKNKGCKKPYIRLSESIQQMTNCNFGTNYTIFVIEEDSGYLDYIKDILKGDTVTVYESKDIEIKKQRNTAEKVPKKDLIYQFNLNKSYSYKTLVKLDEIDKENSYWIRKSRGNKIVFNDHIFSNGNLEDINFLIRDFLKIDNYLFITKGESKNIKGKCVITELIEALLKKAELVYENINGTYSGIFRQEYDTLSSFKDTKIDKIFKIEDTEQDANSVQDYYDIKDQLKYVRHLDERVDKMIIKLTDKFIDLKKEVSNDFDKKILENPLLRIILKGFQWVDNENYNIDNLKQDILKLDIL